MAWIKFMSHETRKIVFVQTCLHQILHHFEISFEYVIVAQTHIKTILGVAHSKILALFPESTPRIPGHYNELPPDNSEKVVSIYIHYTHIINWYIYIHIHTYIYIYIWVFPKIRGTPKSSIFIGVSIISHPFWGIPIFGNTHIYIMYCLQFYCC